MNEYVFCYWDNFGEEIEENEDINEDKKEEPN